MKRVLIINQKNIRLIVVFISILSNFILLLLYAGFIKFRIDGLIKLFNNFNQRITIFYIVKFLSHELIIFFIGILSFLGIVFWRNKKLFFFITLFFLGTELTMVILAPSISLFFIIKLVLTSILIYFILFRHLYNIFINKTSLKILLFLSGVFLYTSLLIFFGILK
jgi:hypothetical protein